MAEVPCEACGGGRLNPISLAVTIADRNIAEVSDLALGEAQEFFEDLELTEREPRSPSGCSRRCGRGSSSCSTSGSTI